MELGWAQQLVDQCVEAAVPAFVKQLGASWARRHGADPRGGDWDRWPGSLRVRELPASVSDR
jgi:protein gp37